MSNAVSPSDAHTSQEHGRDNVHPDGAILLSHFEDLHQQNESTKLGMWTFLATEVMFFSGLFMAYILFRWKFHAGFAEASNLLNTPLGALNTGALLVSSLTMALAVDYAKLGRRQDVNRFLYFTMALGSLFLGVKAYEYYVDYQEGLIPGLNWNPEVVGPATPGVATEASAGEAHGTATEGSHEGGHHRAKVHGDPNHVQMFFVIYFAMTGLHALHMAIGIAALGVMAYLISRSKRVDGTTVESLGLYWHFVDLVWVFLFPLLYLIDVNHKLPTQ